MDTRFSRLRLLGNSNNGDAISITLPLQAVMLMKITIQGSTCRAVDYSKLFTDWCYKQHFGVVS